MGERPDFDEIAVFFDEQVDDMLDNDGEVPSRASEIKAKNRKKQVTPNGRLDVDTRLATDQDDPNVKRFDTNIV